MTTLAAKLSYTPREVGAMLKPHRSGQYVRTLIHRGEIEATRLAGGDYRVSHVEVRRLTGVDMGVPGHEGASDSDEERRLLVQRARRLLAELGVVMAELG